MALEQNYYEALDGDGGFTIANGNIGAALSRAEVIRWLAVDLRSRNTARVLSTEHVRDVPIKHEAYADSRRRSPTLDARDYTLAKRIGDVGHPYRADHRLGPFLRAHEAEIARREAPSRPTITLQPVLGPSDPARTDKGRRLGSQSVIEAAIPESPCRRGLVAQTTTWGLEPR